MPGDDLTFLRRTFELASLSRQRGEWPFGAIVVLRGKVIAESGDSCVANVDVTAHAETLAIRLACQNLGTLDLSDATL
jgi:guanine deaminase